MLHFHLKIAERIGETDGIKALDRNGKALKKEECFRGSSVWVEIRWPSAEMKSAMTG